MPPTKQHPIQSLMERTLDRLDDEGLNDLNDREFQVVLMHYVIASLRNGNGRRSKRQWAGLMATVATMVSAFGASLGFGMAQALGG